MLLIDQLLSVLGYYKFNWLNAKNLEWIRKRGKNVINRS